MIADVSLISGNESQNIYHKLIIFLAKAVSQIDSFNLIKLKGAKGGGGGGGRKLVSKLKTTTKTSL